MLPHETGYFQANLSADSSSLKKKKKKSSLIEDRGHHCLSAFVPFHPGAWKSVASLLAAQSKAIPQKQQPDPPSSPPPFPGSHLREQDSVTSTPLSHSHNTADRSALRSNRRNSETIFPVSPTNAGHSCSESGPHPLMHVPGSRYFSVAFPGGEGGGGKLCQPPRSRACLSPGRWTS